MGKTTKTGAWGGLWRVRRRRKGSLGSAGGACLLPGLGIILQAKGEHLGTNEGCDQISTFKKRIQQQGGRWVGEVETEKRF